MSKIDFSDPTRNLRAFVNLMSDLDPSKPVYSGFGGHIFAYVGNKPAQRLCGVDVWKNPLTGEDCEVQPIHNHDVADELPAQLREATDRRYPEFFEAPALSDWGKPNDSSWGTYMKECGPKPAR